MSLHIEIGQIQKVSDNIVRCPLGTNLMEALSLCSVHLPFVCAGRGTCGKCKIRVIEGQVPDSEEDRRFLSAEEIASGIRLACRVTVNSDMVIDMLADEDDMQAEGFTDTQGTKDAPTIEGVMSDSGSETDSSEPVSTDYSYAIDIGTTTIAVVAVDNISGEVFDEFTCVNHGRSFGADVISRILACENGHGPKLRDIMINDIDTAIGVISSRNNLKIEGLRTIAITGNTAMLHIFAGWSVHGLATAPFTPVTTELTKTDSGILLPGISAYVGADVVSGMYASGTFESDDINLYIDLGTNGEMALGNKNRILVASTAAGPAFEGASLSCGAGSVPGAIADVTLSDEDDEEPIVLSLIGDVCEPVGICGSGIVALAAELLKNGLLGTDGRFDSRLNGRIKLTSDGKITVTQKDIRELQLAKSAIRAGIETLMFTYGVTADDISHVYIAGGFGHGINTKKAAAIGLIPKDLCDVTEAVGNSALAGAVRYAVNHDAIREMNSLIAVSKEVVLADNEFFSRAFLDNMNF